MTAMTVEAACSLLDCDQATLAEKLGVSKSAVSQWKESGEIPIAREYQVMDISAGREPISRSKQAA